MLCEYGSWEIATRCIWIKVSSSPPHPPCHDGTHHRVYPLDEYVVVVVEQILLVSCRIITRLFKRSRLPFDVRAVGVCLSCTVPTYIHFHTHFHAPSPRFTLVTTTDASSSRPSRLFTAITACTRPPSPSSRSAIGRARDSRSVTAVSRPDTAISHQVRIVTHRPLAPA